MTRVGRALAMLSIAALATCPIDARNVFSSAPPQSGTTPLRIDARPNPRTVYEESYALIITADTYDNGAWPRLHASKYGDDLATSLANQSFGVSRLRDPDGVTLRRAINAFVAEHGKADARLLIYFGGHGWHDAAQTGYILGVNAPDPSASPVEIAKAAMNTAQIVGIARASNARHTLFVFDACYSGRLVNLSIDAFTSRSPLYVQSGRRLDDVMKKGAQFISSASGDETTPDQSRFTPEFVRGIAGSADFNHDGMVFASELAIYLKDRVSALGGNAIRPTMPQYGDVLSNGGDFVFSYVPSGQLLTMKAPVIRQVAQNAALQGVRITYFKKSADTDRILRILGNAAADYRSSRSVHSDALPSDGLACNDRTPMAAIRFLAHEMAQAGLPIRSIERIRHQVSADPILQVVSHSPGGGDFWHAPYLSLDFIDQMTVCPATYISGMQHPQT